ncbi:MAG TPA: peptidase, partial [Myxococcales bacterium]|nr:peptidase [Myxococcales bacterium]
HGDGHYTVYGGLGAVAVQVGQQVPANTPLGTVGGQPLFFQVRRGTRALDARAWLGL